MRGPQTGNQENIKTEFDSRAQPLSLASVRDGEGHSQGDGEHSVMECIIDSAH